MALNGKSKPATKPGGPRTIALVGPYLSGKTTLLEGILHVCGATHRRGSIAEKNTVGDTSIEARERQMGVEANVAHCQFMDDRFNFIDCPGSIEFLQESLNVLTGVDAAVVVCEPEPERALVGHRLATDSSMASSTGSAAVVTS